jgi:hypothetical protein
MDHKNPVSDTGAGVFILDIQKLQIFGELKFLWFHLHILSLGQFVIFFYIASFNERFFAYYLNLQSTEIWF